MTVSKLHYVPLVTWEATLKLMNLCFLWHSAGDEQYEVFAREKSIREQTIAESTAEDSSSQHPSHPEVIMM